ncbi:hypothetical protein BTVI_44242 [Pitangus sulphuratus]|nr:hypothetical protein BTVI_44242 [Pitangus sulphuratus]
MVGITAVYPVVRLFGVEQLDPRVLQRSVLTWETKRVVESKTPLSCLRMQTTGAQDGLGLQHNLLPQPPVADKLQPRTAQQDRQVPSPSWKAESFSLQSCLLLLEGLQCLTERTLPFNASPMFYHKE